MILFLNFAPIEFMGGAEKWMNDTAKKIHKHEDSMLISTDPRIANIYGSIVLKRKFEKRSEAEIHNHAPITYSSLIPFTSGWRKINNAFQKSRLIYAKYELLEILIILYFGGVTSLKKTIAGIHSPFIYSSPEGFLSRLHNVIYGSNASIKLLSAAKRVHVLNKRDEHLMTNVFNLDNDEYVPNGTATISQKDISKPTNKSILKVLTVGELSKRKGTDTLLQIIAASSKNFEFTVIGDGPMRKEIEAAQKKNNRLKYEGFIEHEKILNNYRYGDALLLPSRAESMSLVVLEAMAHGLTIINSSETSLSLDRRVEHSARSRDVDSYINILKKLLKTKFTKKLDKLYVHNYFSKNFSFDIVEPQLYKKVFDLSI